MSDSNRLEVESWTVMPQKEKRVQIKAWSRETEGKAGALLSRDEALEFASEIIYQCKDGPR